MMKDTAFPPLPSYAGIRIIEDPSLRDFVGLDLSRCRSPARALRRRATRSRRGRPKRSLDGNVREIWKPKKEAYHLRAQNAMVMHPAMAAEIRKHLAALRPSDIFNDVFGI
jgi:hypothetical protein